MQTVAIYQRRFLNFLHFYLVASNLIVRHSIIFQLSVQSIVINPLYKSGLFYYCYMLDKFIRHFRGVESIFSLLFYFILYGKSRL